MRWVTVRFRPDRAQEACRTGSEEQGSHAADILRTAFAGRAEHAVVFLL